MVTSSVRKGLTVCIDKVRAEKITFSHRKFQRVKIHMLYIPQVIYSLMLYIYVYVSINEMYNPEERHNVDCHKSYL